jgi:hypothetical protein
VREPILLPARLAAYRQRCLAGERWESSVRLVRNADGWWLTRACEEEVPPQTPPEAPVVGGTQALLFLTTSTGKHYSSFQGSLAKRHQHEQHRAQRRCKATWRACLKQKSVERLPTTRNAKLARTARQETNRAVNELNREHAGSQIAFERLTVATMRFKACRMNADSYAANLAHVFEPLAGGAAKRAAQATAAKATAVKSAVRTQARPRCDLVARSHCPEQHTCCCGVCGWRMHADHTAAISTWQELKALLEARHQRWRTETGWS